MGNKKTNELRELSESELIRMKSDTLAKMREIRFKSKIEPPKNFMEKKDLKKTIARINTILREYELKGSQ